MRDLASNVIPSVMLGAAGHTADQNGTALDLQGYDSCLAIINPGIGGITFDTTNKIEFVAEHSDDNSTFTAVAVSDLVGFPNLTNGIVRSLIAAHAAPSVAEVSYIGSKRYFRIRTDFSGTHGTGTPIAIVGLRGKAAGSPV